jgi:AcrR family transcriptional regulator
VPRRYALGKRQDQKDATRDRIVAAAAELFRTQGATRTSFAQVAAAADVAPGTVRNHFPSIEELAAAVAAHVMAMLEMPGPEIFAGIDDPAARVAALARAMAAYYERSQPWYRMADLDDRPLSAWDAARARYDADYEALIREALGPLGADDDAVAVVAGLLDPGVFGALGRRGRSGTAAAELLGTLLAPWLAGPDLRR